MSRLDNAGMHRAYRDLMQAFAFHREKRIGGAHIRCRRACPERMLNAPKAEVEPGSRVRRANRHNSVQAVNGAFEPDGRRVQRADRRERFVRTFNAHDRNVFAIPLDERHVHRAGCGCIAPEAEQRGVARGDFLRHFAPGVRRDDQARPWAMIFNSPALNGVDDRGHRFIPAVQRHSETTRPAPAACRRRRRVRVRDG